MKVCDIIIQQLSRSTLALLGAEKLVDLGNGLQFNIQGSQKVQMVQIILKPCDTYTLKFWNRTAKEYKLTETESFKLYKWKLVSSIGEVYFDMLHDIIEQETGLYTTFHPRS